MGDGAGWLTKPLMFLSSYAPLFVMLAIRFDGLTLRAVCVAIAVVGVIGAYGLLRRQTSVSPGAHTIVSVESAGGAASAYLAGYLLPFVTAAEPSVRDLIAYSLFLLVAGVVHVRTGIIQVNPTLFLLGWTVLAVTDDQGFRGYLLTKQRVLPRATVHASRIADDVLVDRIA